MASKVALLMHCDGVNTSTTFIEETGKTVTRAGTVAINDLSPGPTPAFGAFAYFSNGSGLMLTNSPDWLLGTDDFTIELWVSFASLNVFTLYEGKEYITLITQGIHSSPFANSSFAIHVINKVPTGVIYLDGVMHGVAEGPGQLVNDVWYHIVYQRTGTQFQVFVNGVGGTVVTSAAAAGISTRDLNIGRDGGTQCAALASIDEIRITTGLAWYDGNFTPPIVPFPDNSIQPLYVLNDPNAYASSSGDSFGNAAAVSGNWAIVGARYEDSVTTSDNQGKAYIFDVTTGLLVHTLNNPNSFAESTTNDEFGYAVDISGNYAIVGSPYEDTSSAGDNQGKAYIFDVTTGLLVHTLNNPNSFAATTSGDFFGCSVAISGNYAIIGAIEEDTTGNDNQGKAYIFDVTTGLLVHVLHNPDSFSGVGSNLGDKFGVAVDISGNYAIVGASGEDALATYDDRGRAYIFNVTTGLLVRTLVDPNAFWTTLDYFGSSVAIDGNKCIVGAFTEDSLAVDDNQGKAYIFDVSTGSLLLTLDNPNAFPSSTTGDSFGHGVDISGNSAIVSAYYEDTLTIGDNQGKAYIFDVTTGDIKRKLNNPNAFANTTTDLFGSSVAIDGDVAVVGAWAEDTVGNDANGKAYIFKLNLLTELALSSNFITGSIESIGIDVSELARANNITTIPIVKRVFKDVDMSFRSHPDTNNILIKTDHAAVRQAIVNLLTLRRGDKPFHPEIASPIYKYLFSNFNLLEKIVLQNEIKLYLNNYEPRLDVIDVTVSADHNYLTCNISGTIINLFEPITVNVLIERLR